MKKENLYAFASSRLRVQKILISVLIFFGMYGCNYTKNLTQDQYLLTKTEIVSDDKKIDTDLLEDYIVQKPNTSFLGMKPGLAIYNWAGKDSTFFNKLWWKIGAAPVIYNPANSSYSSQQLQQQLFNWGYLNANVDYTDEKSDKKKRASVTYHLHPGIPYRIRSFNLNVPDSAQHRILERSLRQEPIKVNAIFDQDELGGKLSTFSTALRNRGYFTFGTEYLQYVVDSTLNNHEVDLSLNILPRKIEDESGNITEMPHEVHKLDRINIYSGSTMTGSRNRRNYVITDTTKNENTFIHYDKNKFLNERTLLGRSYLYSGRNYSERLVERSYEALSALTCVKQVTMDFTEKAGNLLDCNIHIIPGNIHWIQGTIEGTNSAGDLGVAATVSYQHRNIFNGAEIFRVKLRGAYEAITGNRPSDILDDNYYEYGIETGLSFPRFLVKIPHLRERQGSTDIKLSVNNQSRAEYQRVFFNAGIAYKWLTDRNRLNHTWDIFDLNYITMPKVSELFKETVLDNPDNPILRYSYEDQFILRMSYGLIFNMQKRGAKASEYQTLRTNIEFAGNLLYGISKLSNLKKDENDRYQIFKNPFAQYFKVDGDFVKSIYVNSRASLVLHSSLGVAYPYLNSIVMPYEKRYFSGGSNSLRGWNTRELGPGSYDNKGVTDFMNQSGDIKLDLNAEFRYSLGGPFQIAAFYDAGNIWTIRNYENQPGGEFKWNQFYKEIAMSTGLGIRLDFGFFLIRVDGGLKVFDPAETGSDCWRILKPRLNRDVAFHFAIGYPF